MQALNIRLYDKKALFSQTLGHKRKLNFCCLSYRGNHSNTPPPVPLCRDGNKGYSGKKTVAFLQPKRAELCSDSSLYYLQWMLRKVSTYRREGRPSSSEPVS